MLAHHHQRKGRFFVHSGWIYRTTAGGGLDNSKIVIPTTTTEIIAIYFRPPCELNWANLERSCGLFTFSAHHSTAFSIFIMLAKTQNALKNL